MKKIFYILILLFLVVSFADAKTVVNQKKSKWDYLENEISCDYDNVCFDKKNKKITGKVKQNMFDYYAITSYVNGVENGDIKFYTQSNKFIAGAKIKDGRPADIPLDNEAFRNMMTEVAEEKHNVLALVVYLDDCISAYRRQNTDKENFCQELLKGTKVPEISNGKNFLVKRTAFDGKKYISVEMPPFHKKYISEFQKKTAPNITKKNKKGNFVYLVEYF